jgi:hypothetical protein
MASTTPSSSPPGSATPILAGNLVVSTVAKLGPNSAGDGPVSKAPFYAPLCIAVGPDGSVYVVDWFKATLNKSLRMGAPWFGMVSVALNLTPITHIDPVDHPDRLQP